MVSCSVLICLVQKKEGSNIFGDFNLVIRLITGKIDCKGKLLNNREMKALQEWVEHECFHVKRDWNQSADRLATTEETILVEINS